MFSSKRQGGQGCTEGTEAELSPMKIAIVAAMEREVALLIRGWKSHTIEQDGRKYKLFENGNAVLICGGIGPGPARRATEAVIGAADPARVVSVGFAGALDGTLKIADIVEPRTVINASDGSRVDTGSGQGALVSYAAVAEPGQKQRLSEAYGAVAVDMEASAVAQGAQARGIGFAAFKAISDVADCVMPPLQQFVSSDGQFRSGRFVLHTAARPWFWRRAIELGLNSAKASRSLCLALENYLGRDQ